MAGTNNGRKRKTSKITLYAGVPFDDTYKHVVNWDNITQINDFLDNDLNTYMPITQEGSYQSIIKPLRWNTKEKSFNDLTLYNYVRIVNTDNTTGKSKTYYGFITRVEYENDGLSYIYYSIDMWNTYKWAIDLQSAMIEQGFCKEVKDDFSDWTNDFQEIRHNQQEIGGDGALDLRYSSNANFNQGEDGLYFADKYLKFLVIVAQPQDVQKETGSFIGAYSQYHFYIMPYNLETNKTINVFDKDGNRIYQGGFDLDDQFKTMSENTNLVGSTSKVVDCEVYDYVGIPFVGVDDGIKFTKSVKCKEDQGLLLIQKFNGQEPQKGICFPDDYKDAPNRMTNGKNMFERLQNFMKDYVMPPNWQSIAGPDFPYMLISSPFTSLHFTDGRGTDGVFDIFKYNHLKFENFPIWRWGALAENGKQVYTLPNYNRDTVSEENQGTLRTHENAMMIDDSARDTPIILDNYAMFMQSNKNQLANTRTNAKISERLAKEGNSISLGQTNRGVQAQQDIMGNNINTQYAQFENNNMGQFAQLGYQGTVGTVGNILTGNPLGALQAAGGALVGAGSSAIGMHFAGQNLDLSSANQRKNFGISSAVTQENARENYAYSNKVATNNYEATIRSQNAMLADVRNANDQVAHMGTGQLWDSQNGNTQMSWQIYTCQDAVLLNTALYFNLFGYRIKKYEPIINRMYCKTVFNYVRTSNANVSGRVNHAVIDTINLMLDNGVTFWNPNKLDDFSNRRITNNTWN